jgi:hypothetical protein
MLHPLVVVGVAGRKLERNREQSRRLRRQIEPRCIGAANDRRTLDERGIVEREFGQEGVEAAQIADLADFDAGNLYGIVP